VLSYKASLLVLKVSAEESRADQPLQALNDQSKFIEWDRYPICKLLTLYLARELGEVAGSAVLVSVTNPSMARTDLDREMVARGEIGLAARFFQYALGRSAWSASRTLLFPLVGDAPQAAYFVNGVVSEWVCASGLATRLMRAGRPSDWSLSEESNAVQSKIWSELQAICSKLDEPSGSL
jgi:hypothetical protein